MSTTADNNNCFLSFNSQYKKNRAFSKISNGIPKLNTAKNEKVFGGKNGNKYDNNNTAAAMVLKK